MRPLVTLARAREIVERFAGTTIGVVGDVMLDQFLVGNVTRISPEAPVPVLAFEREESRLGGAGNVAANVRAHGARACLVGVVGRDAAAATVRDLLDGHGVADARLVRSSSRSTTRKVRLVTTRNQQVARVDYEDDRELTAGEQADVIACLDAMLAVAGLVVVSDYRKGLVTAAVMDHLVREAEARRAPVVVDPKIPNVGRYRGATLVTPNHHEAEAATAMRIRTPDEARQAARRFREVAGCGSVLVTWGEHGMWLLDGPGADAGVPNAEFGVPAAAREVADVTGAGDTVVATLGLALAAGATLAEAAVLANYAAGVAVGKFGAATVGPAELLDAVARG
jgi:D-beta-D-heptose 7-phosphate kinase/D-beta-D-heptose 1-phosphate adenosyltransferase